MENKIELTQQELYNIIKEAYRNGYSQYEIVEAGLEPLDIDGYVRYVMKNLNDKQKVKWEVLVGTKPIS